MKQNEILWNQQKMQIYIVLTFIIHFLCLLIFINMYMICINKLKEYIGKLSFVTFLMCAVCIHSCPAFSYHLFVYVQIYSKKLSEFDLKVISTQSFIIISFISHKNGTKNQSFRNIYLKFNIILYRTIYIWNFLGSYLFNKQQM